MGEKRLWKAPSSGSYDRGEYQNGGGVEVERRQGESPGDQRVPAGWDENGQFGGAEEKV